MTKKKTKERNPQDTTLVNVRASVKRIDKLTARVERLEKQMKVMAEAVKKLW